MQLKSKDEIVKSPLNFTGGKYKLLPQLLPLFPDDIDTFVDLFCGGCNVALNVNAKKIICNDKDDKLIGLFSFLKKHNFTSLYHKLIYIIDKYNLSNSNKNGYPFYNCDSAIGLGEYNRTGFKQLKDTFNSTSYEDENYYLMLYVLIVFSFNNQIRFNSKGQFNLPVGKRDFNQQMQDKLEIFLSTVKKQKIYFKNKDFAQILPNTLSSKAFVYADPPYLITCATYNEKHWNESEEKRLLLYLDNISKIGIRFALSNVLSTDNKANTILSNWLENNSNYICHHLNYSYKNSNYHKKNIAKTDEVLITNY
ncbi:MAG: DNA adenine methylase [Spirochaetia bacterium]|nr:DNA adenine methylase [Spirochaetia bacterium]